MHHNYECNSGKRRGASSRLIVCCEAARLRIDSVKYFFLWTMWNRVA